MHLLLEVSDDTNTAMRELNAASAQLTPSLSALASHEVLIECGEALDAYARDHRVALVLSEGMVDVRLGGFPLASMEPGDIITPTTHVLRSSLLGNFAVRARPVPWTLCEEHLRADHAFFQSWFQLLACERALFSQLAADFLGRAIGESAGNSAMPVSLAPGDTVVRQGEATNDVYTVIEGSLDALVDGVKVGTIEKDEIFGAISALAEAPRTATVVATTSALILKLPKADFMQLMRTRPATTLNLVRSMARAIMQANAKLVQLHTAFRG